MRNKYRVDQLGIHLDQRAFPLEIYHASINYPKVLEEGFKIKKDVDLQGLGGGEERAISFTGTLGYAEAIAWYLITVVRLIIKDASLKDLINEFQIACPKGYKQFISDDYYGKQMEGVLELANLAERGLWKIEIDMFGSKTKYTEIRVGKGEVVSIHEITNKVEGKYHDIELALDLLNRMSLYGSQNNECEFVAFMNTGNLIDTFIDSDLSVLDQIGVVRSYLKPDSFIFPDKRTSFDCLFEEEGYFLLRGDESLVARKLAGDQRYSFRLGGFFKRPELLPSLSKYRFDFDIDAGSFDIEQPSKETLKKAISYHGSAEDEYRIFSPQTQLFRTELEANFESILNGWIIPEWNDEVTLFYPKVRMGCIADKLLG